MIRWLKQGNLASVKKRWRLTEDVDWFRDGDSEERSAAQDKLDQDADERFFIPDFVE